MSDAAAGRRGSRVEAALLRAFDAAGGARHRLERLVPGRRFLLAEVRSPEGELLGGLASCREVALAWPKDADSPLDIEEASRLLTSERRGEAAIGLATINAVLNRGLATSTEGTPVDGVDWLLEVGRSRHVALIGRFPFIEDELRPVAGRLSIFELEPREGEYGPHQMAEHLPAAEIIAITASTILNHSLDEVLEHRGERARVLVLGPSTPMTPVLLELGVDRLAGIVIADVERTARGVEEALTFRQLGGTRRVCLAV